MRPFKDEEGFTTTSMVLSMLITLALVFTAAQVYRVNSASAEVQDVADAAALSAQTQVAEFMIVARFCDAVVLSLSLTGIAMCGLGIVALCIPPAATLSEGLIEAGEKVLEARDRFSSRAKQALDKLQEALPFFAAACAAGVARANNGDSSGADYLGLALLVPARAESTEADQGDESGQLVDDVEDKADAVRELAEEAEEAAKEANAAKQRGFAHDCGNNPGYCMYERASSLAGLSGASNPLYSSIDAWSFSTALARAQRYYSHRRTNDAAEGNSVEDTVRWKMRLAFYSYAADLIASEGYVNESGDSFAANFPHLPKNTDEMKSTSLYTDAVYPITEEPHAEGGDGGGGDEGDGGGQSSPVMHAWAGCPGATGEVVAYDSLSYKDSAGLETCPVCGFTAASLGKVASASTAIENGFEYHYEAVAQAAADYQSARQRADASNAAVKDEAGGLFDQLAAAFEEAVDKRVKVSPPGRFGALAIVVNKGETPAAGGFASGFVASGGALGTRAAISAATLVDEGSDEGRTVLNSLVDGLREDGGVAVGALGAVLDVWSAALSAYGEGVDALADGVESGLNAIPLATASGLGTWAAGKLREVVEAAGLQPAELAALKPVLVNSQYVAEKDSGAAGGRLVAVKQQVLAHPLYSTSLFSSLLTDVERQAIERVDALGDSIDIASIELFGGGGPSIPVTIPLPAEVKQFGIGALQGVFDRIRESYAEASGVRAWE